MQKPNDHTMGRGCFKCGIEKLIKYNTSNTDEFIEKSKKVHGDKYDYSLVEYQHSKKNVKIICKLHGLFLQKPHNHIHNLCGCPICNESKGENKIRKFLEKNMIKYIKEKKFNECKNKRRLPFDFYLPKKNILIEYDGEHHYRNVWGDKQFKLTKENDDLKNKFAKKNNIKLLRISYKDFIFINKILKDNINY